LIQNNSVGSQIELQEEQLFCCATGQFVFVYSKLSEDEVSGFVFVVSRYCCDVSLNKIPNKTRKLEIAENYDTIKSPPKNLREEKGNNNNNNSIVAKMMITYMKMRATVTMRTWRRQRN